MTLKRNNENIIINKKKYEIFWLISIIENKKVFSKNFPTKPPFPFIGSQKEFE